MKLVSQTYIDKNGNEWVIQKESLPKKRGSFNYWTAECKKLNKSYREESKKLLKETIEQSQCNHEWSEPYGNLVQCFKCDKTIQTWELQKFN